MSNIPTTEHWLDTLDSEPNADDQAWLASGPLTLARLDAASPPVSANADLRYDWLQSRQRPNLVVTLLLMLLFAFFAHWLWEEFAGVWQPSWGMIVPAILTAICGRSILRRLGGALPFSKSPCAGVTPLGLTLHLSMGRNPHLRQFSYKYATLPALFRRQRFFWTEIAQVGLYCVKYNTQATYQTIYWLTLWNRKGQQYTALVTANEHEASTLAETIVSRAGLYTWAEVGNELVVINPRFGDIDQRTSTDWQATRQRISGSDSQPRITGELWRAQPAPLPYRPKRSIPYPLIVVALIIASFFYNQLVSLLILPPWQTSVSGTVIPPLHELWHTPSDGRVYNWDTPSFVWRHDLTLNGDGIISAGYKKVSLYSKAGAMLGQFDADQYNGDPFYPEGIGIKNGRLAFGRHLTVDTIGAYGFPSAAIGDNKLFFPTNSPLNTPAKQGNYLTAADISSSKILWQQPIMLWWQDKHSKVIWEPQHKLVITIFSKPDSNDKQAAVMALNADNGNIVWQQDIHATSPMKWDLALNDDTLYVEYTDTSRPQAVELTALDAASGTLRWTKVAASPLGPLTADANQAYIQHPEQITAFAKQDGSRHDFDILNASILAANLSGSLYDVSSTVTGDILYIITGDKSAFDLFVGRYRIEAYSLKDGHQIWRTNLIKAESFTLVVSDGILYIVHDNALYAYAGTRLGGIFMLLYDLQLRIIHYDE